MIATGLALGIALVITVESVSAGMTQAQDKVRKSLYGLGADMTVAKARSAPQAGGSQGPGFDAGRLACDALPRGHRVGTLPAWGRTGSPGSARCSGCAPFARGPCVQAWPVSNREIRPSSPTVKVHRVRISPQVSLR